MPRSILSQAELAELIGAILSEHGSTKAEKLLETEHEHFSPIHPNGEGLQEFEKYFMKKYAYKDFELHVAYFLTVRDAVVAADLQFKRPSKFPAPYWNRNRQLVKELIELLSFRYSEKGIEVRETERSGRQIHYAVSGDRVALDVSSTFEEWGSECALYDEPNSSGSSDPSLTKIRNDFVIVRYRKRPNQSVGAI